jgi:hypothetical protein
MFRIPVGVNCVQTNPKSWELSGDILVYVLHTYPIRGRRGS